MLLSLQCPLSVRSISRNFLDISRQALSIRVKTGKAEKPDFYYNFVAEIAKGQSSDLREAWAESFWIQAEVVMVGLTEPSSVGLD